MASRMQTWYHRMRWAVNGLRSASNINFGVSVQAIWQGVGPKSRFVAFICGHCLNERCIPLFNIIYTYLTFSNDTLAELSLIINIMSPKLVSSAYNLVAADCHTC